MYIIWYGNVYKVYYDVQHTHATNIKTLISNAGHIKVDVFANIKFECEYA